MTRLAAVIELILAYHPKALRVLTGEHVPTLMELSEVVRDAGEHDAAGFISAALSESAPGSAQLAGLVRGEALQSVIDDAGGWEHIVEAVRFYRRAFPTTWAIFADHILTVAPGGASRLEDEAQLARMAGKYRVRRATVCEKRRIVPETVARYAEMTPRGEFRYLSEPGPDKPARFSTAQFRTAARNDVQQLALPFEDDGQAGDGGGREGAALPEAEH
jgi:hypothetical protein